MLFENDLVWLHISDLHIEPTRKAWDYTPVLDSLVEDLKKQYLAHQIRPDLIFITGDLAFGELPGSTMAKQYDAAAAFLDKVRNSFGAPIPKKNVYIVPGNHDVNIRRFPDATSALLDKFRNAGSDDEIARIQSEPSNDDYSLFMQRLNEYQIFLANNGYSHLLSGDHANRLMYSAHHNVKGVTVGIAGFNSAWSCAGKREQGQILVGRWQYEMLSQELKDNCQARIALIHHPIDWVSELEKNFLRARFAETFDFTLHGHEHEVDVRQDLPNRNVTVSAAAAYQGSKPRNGYNFVHWPIDSDAGPTVILRRYTSEPGGRGWIPDGRVDFPDGKYKVTALHGIPKNDATTVHRPMYETGSRSGDVLQRTTVAERALDDRLIGEFGAVLKPSLERLRELLETSRVGIALFGPRLSAKIPNIPKEYNIEAKEIAAKVEERLNHQQSRDSSKIQMIVLEDDGSLKLVADSPESNGSGWATQFRNRVTSVHDSQHADEWAHLIVTDILELLLSWQPGTNGPILYPIKYVQDKRNRDIIGFISADLRQAMTQQKAIDVRRLVDRSLLPILRNMCMQRTRMSLISARSRDQILSTVLDSALSLTGADWGCIKTACLGAKRIHPFTREDQSTTELVRAECVLNCPRFFHEGRLLNTEGLIDKAIRADEDSLWPIELESRKSMSHPAAYIFVALIRDPSGVAEPRIQGSDVIGALVVQQVSENYLAEHMYLYKPLLQELCSMVAPAIRSIAAESMANVIQSKIDLAKSIQSLTEGFVKRTFVDAEGWVLLEPIENGFRTVAKSENAKHLFSLLGIAPELPYSTSILGVARDNKVILFTPEGFNSSSKQIGIKRWHGDDSATAYFSNEFKEAAKKLTDTRKEKLIFDLGDPKPIEENEQQHGGGEVSMIVGPIIFPTGLPVGLLAVASSQGINDVEAENFQKGLQSLAEPLWAEAKQIRNQRT